MDPVFTFDWVAEDSLMVRAQTPHSVLQLKPLQAHYHNTYAEQLIDSVLAYDTLLLIFTLPCAQQFNTRLDLPVPVLNALPTVGQQHRIPVCYDAEFALDLADIAAHTGLSPQAVIAAHQSTEYRVLAMGFSPGFGYCGSLPEALSMPRKAHPRTQVPAGSVAIAENQTAIYPNASPGGWHILGRCPLRLFDASQPLAHASLLQTGDRVCFYAIDRNTFDHWVERQ